MQTFKYLLLTFFSLSFSAFAEAKIPSISILTNANNFKSTVARFAIEDVVSLLQKACLCDVQLNNTNAQILIELPNISAQKPSISKFNLKEKNYEYLTLENEDYSWYSQHIDDGILLQLQASSYQGLSNGLYGLLQEQLWFSFYHPVETHIPTLNYWPLSESFYWHANARFDKRGFHLNTLQQIELSNALLNPKDSEAESLLIQYIDWLARNGQNYFEFIITNKIDSLNWSNDIQGIIDYSHARGIKIGLSIAFDKKAEAAYRLTKNKWYQSSPKKRAEIAKNLHPICKNDWDIINIFWERDYGNDNKINKRQNLGAYAQNYIDSTTKAYVFFQYNLENPIKINPQKDSNLLALDLKKGFIFENTLLLNLQKNKQEPYSLSQTKNLRETWFMEQLNKGLGFDHTQPFLLLSYLSVIWDNIQYNHKLGIRGNISKSNGWEWGYWLMDWSAARWNWEHSYNGKPYSMEATQFLSEIFKRERVANLLSHALQLQDSLLIQKNLITYLTLDTLGQNYPKVLSNNDTPNQTAKVKWLNKKAKIEEITAFKDSIITPLMQLGKDFDAIVNALAKEEILIQDIQLRALLGEFIRALKVSALRIKHKAYLLEYVSSKRLNKLTNKPIEEAALQKAIQMRQEAVTYINLQGFIYRYDKKNIIQPAINFTAYTMGGYLAQSNNLQLWQLEESMYSKGKYKNIKRQYLKIKSKIGL